MTTARPNRQAISTARLLEYGAPQIANALNHAALELAHADSYPATTLGDGGSRGNNPLTATEAAANKRWDIRADIAQIHDDLDAIDQLVKSLLAVCAHTLRTRTPTPTPTNGGKPRCYTDPGLAGYLTPRTEGGWSDPACTNIPRNGITGMCDSCRKRCQRWRQQNNQPDLDTPTPNDDTTTVNIINGVAHTRTHVPHNPPA